MSIDIVGNIASWSGKRIDRDQFFQALDGLGLGQHVPMPNTVKNMEYILNKCGHHAAGFNGFDSIKCERKWTGRKEPDFCSWDIFGTERNSWKNNAKTRLMTVTYRRSTKELGFYRTFDDISSNIQIALGDADNITAQDAFLRRFPRMEAQFIDSLSGGEVTKTFKEILDTWGDAFSIKDGGSMYWLPPSRKDMWKNIQNKLHSIVPVQLFSQAGDANTLDSLFVALENSLTEDVSKLEGMMASSEATDFHLRKRKELSERLSYIVNSYQGVLGSRMDALVDRLTKAGALSVQANASAVSMIEDDAIFSDLPY
tara:strand:+ start:9459 stop:10397 length:939 start_codon:yes stop_codon:yes gene_type:complete